MRKNLVRVAMLFALSAHLLTGCGQSNVLSNDQVRFFTTEAETGWKMPADITCEAVIGDALWNYTDEDFQILSITAHVGSSLELIETYLFAGGQIWFNTWPYPVSLEEDSSVTEIWETRSTSFENQTLESGSFRSFAFHVALVDSGNSEQNYLSQVTVELKDSSGAIFYAKTTDENRRWIEISDAPPQTARACSGS